MAAQTDAILAMYEDQIDRGQELLPDIAASVFRMSELAAMADYRGRIDAILARNKELAETPLAGKQASFYRAARAAGYDEVSARNMARMDD